MILKKGVFAFDSKDLNSIAIFSGVSSGVNGARLVRIIPNERKPYFILAIISVCRKLASFLALFLGKCCFCPSK